MKKYFIFFSIIILSISWSLCFAQEFDPAEDGWYFENWGEVSPNCVGSCDLSWDLFRQAYLGVNPTQNIAQAPLDCAFYELFQGIAAGGNCGGMSLLSLSLFKYGGYMSFCSPANFYTGTDGPDRDDLHQAINILQARQFSAAGISNFIDIFDAGNIDDAENAYKDVKECLAKGDYPVISIATDAVGGSAHTVIPYRVEESGGTKIMYIWDPNHPYDDDPTHYASTSTANRMEITGPTSWSYTSGSTTYTGSGGFGAWCFCIPMSIVRPKSRHPMAVDMVNEALMSLFVGSPASGVSQITDNEGNRFYKIEKDVHTLKSDIETDPNKRIKGMVRWPWFGRGPAGKEQPHGELYFVRCYAKKALDLNVTLSGKKYEAVISFSGNLIQINSESLTRTKDVVRLSKLASADQAIEIKTLGAERDFAVRQLRTDVTGKKWRRFHVKNIKVTQAKPVKIQTIGDMEALQVSSREQKIGFDLEIQQQVDGKVTTRSMEKLSTEPGELLKIAPRNWRTLEKTEIKKEMKRK